MSKSNTYVLNEKLAKTQQTRFGWRFRCEYEHCSDPGFVIGDKIVSRAKGRRQHKRWLHYECWNKLCELELR